MTADPAIGALNSLLRNVEIEDHDEALKLANAAIRAAPKGSRSSDLTTAQHTRVVALLKLDRFDDALRAIAEGGASLEEVCPLEKAYALYKTGQLEEAWAILQQQKGAARGLKHLTAQVAYRAEKFEYAATIYRELLVGFGKDQDGGRYGEENDLRINLLAANAQLEWQGKGWAVPEDQKQPGREELEAFETSYNAACGCLARGDYAKASMLLKRARDLCEASEDLSDEEKKAELLPILVQQAHVATKLGKLDEAASLHKSITLSEIPDASTRLVAQSNTLVLQAESNPFMAQRLFESLPDVKTGNDRLFEYQTSMLQRNKHMIDLRAQKFSGVQKAATRILSKEPAPAISSPFKADLGVLNAAAACELSTGKEALRRILPLLDSRPDDVGLLLTIIQLYIQLNNPAPALDLLEAFFKRLETATTTDHADVRFAPGLVALAVALYRLQGRHSAIRSELAKAAAHWQKKEETSSEGSGSGSGSGNGNLSLVREAGIELLHSSHPTDLAVAGNAFSQLVTAQPSDRLGRAGLVASFATSDFAKVQPHLDALPSVDQLLLLGGGVDIKALIEAGVAHPPPPPLSAASQSKKRKLLGDESSKDKQQQQQQPAKKQRRARKNKLPKNNYDPDKQPDPERWLPLRDRSSYRPPKGKKGKKSRGGGGADTTQGGVVREEHQETLELAGGAGSVKVEKATPGFSSSSGGGAGKNKKKKGGKK
ncbi:signal recognition particle subunit SRP72 [Diplogelasinospora grovesii]|uniref:Signal recognition particle subunit SRP72 n=1 Tax=Diplogelasinospora grovesii TaxID=303347 RepID=A0AAN6S9I1_9PEZI|nr:signal recognition particle subunit SRP72 [Diplogelasinospora grovesii]